MSVQKYEVNGVLFDLLNVELKEVALGSYTERDRSGSGVGTIIASDHCKEAQQEFKNYDYILRLTRNKGRIRVPLSLIVEYKGFVAFAKASIPYAEQYGSM